jgi:hypothetical protein
VSDYFERVERQLVRSVEAGAARPRWRIALPSSGALAPIAALLVVVAVVGVFLGVRSRSGTVGAAHATTVTFTASPSPGRALDRALSILRARVSARFHDVQVSRAGNQVTVSAGGATRAQIVALAVPGQVALYDWEANALNDNGAGVAALLKSRDATAIAISQGTDGLPAGSSGTAGLAAYDAVRLASHQAPEPAADNVRSGPAYYMFGTPGSTACTIVARAGGFAQDPSEHCLLAGPAATPGQLLAALPAGVSPSAGHVLRVPRGIAVLQSLPPNVAHPPPIASPDACFYVLRDHAALVGGELTNPQVGRAPDGSPEVSFGFTARGGRAFERVTAVLARRAAALSTLGVTLDQHFAVALDGKLVSVPSIDFHLYPNGLLGSNGADLVGFTPSSARDFAILLRFGPLPVSLQPR